MTDMQAVRLLVDHCAESLARLSTRGQRAQRRQLPQLVSKRLGRPLTNEEVKYARREGRTRLAAWHRYLYDGRPHPRSGAACQCEVCKRTL